MPNQETTLHRAVQQKPFHPSRREGLKTVRALQCFVLAGKVESSRPSRRDVLPPTRCTALQPCAKIIESLEICVDGCIFLSVKAWYITVALLFLSAQVANVEASSCRDMAGRILDSCCCDVQRERVPLSGCCSDEQGPAETAGHICSCGWTLPVACEEAYVFLAPNVSRTKLPTLRQPYSTMSWVPPNAMTTATGRVCHSTEHHVMKRPTRAPVFILLCSILR